jgi:hypothetical protein
VGPSATCENGARPIRIAKTSLFQKFKTTSSTLRASAAVRADPKRDFYRDYHRTITSLGLDGRLIFASRSVSWYPS